MTFKYTYFNSRFPFFYKCCIIVVINDRGCCYGSY
nr:MAG TPA: hypothetical protein [Caudoviricetes sp.]